MLLCLDFDGVLHNNVCNDGLFAHVPLLARWLERWPGVDVVISSSWRTAHTQEKLVEMLGLVVGARIVGCTPVPPRDEVGRDYRLVGVSRRYERQSEIETWMKSSWHPQRPWVALDDMACLFEPDCQRLVVCDGRIGMTEETLGVLDQHAEWAGITPVGFGTAEANQGVNVDQVVTLGTYLKHSFSCLPDVKFEIVIDHPRRLITISSKGFDSSLFGWLVTSILPLDTGITAYRDDDAGWGVPRPAYELRVRIESTGHGAVVEMVADVVKLSSAIGGGVAVRLTLPPQARLEGVC